MNRADSISVAIGLLLIFGLCLWIAWQHGRKANPKPRAPLTRWQDGRNG